MGTDAPAVAPGQAPAVLRVLLAVAACGSVLPLLGWVAGMGSFSGLGLVVALPLVAGLVAAAVWMDRTGWWPATRAGITAGALGGLLGTLGYDVFRVPFVLGGLQLLAPIDSYGVLLLDASTSSPWTGLAGWSYHVVNGVGFGIALGVVTRHRTWWWGIVWALVLETATVVSPFATTYALRDADGFRVLPIALAYAAHVPYGLAIGAAVQQADRVHEAARSVVRAPVAVCLVATLVGFAVWQGVPTAAAVEREAATVADGPSAVLVDARLRPTWLRVAPGGCVTIVSRDPGDAELGPGLPVTVPAGQVVEVCPAGERAVRRVRVDGAPFSGGWIIVDDAAG